MKWTYPIPRETRPKRVAIYGNEVPRWRVQTFHQLTCMSEVEIMVILTVEVDLAKNIFAAKIICQNQDNENQSTTFPIYGSFQISLPE
jgi:hypothetical protein